MLLEVNRGDMKRTFTGTAPRFVNKKHGGSVAVGKKKLKLGISFILS